MCVKIIKIYLLPLFSTLSWTEDSGLLGNDKVVVWVVPDILKVYNALIFDGQAALEQLIFLNFLTLKDKVITVQKVRNHSLK